MILQSPFILSGVHYRRIKQTAFRIFAIDTFKKKKKPRIKQISTEANKQWMHNGKAMWPQKNKIDFIKYQNLLIWVNIICYKRITTGHD